jgi:maleylpyruvate isomerase
LRRNDQSRPDYLGVNPQGLVPTLDDGGRRLIQSLAIIEYLDERHREPPLLPDTPQARARVRAIALAIACDIHPIDNLRVLRYLMRTVGATEEVKDAWYRHWIELGLRALEVELVRDPATGEFCHGDAPTLADCCLVPQLANARRVNLPLDSYPTLRRIEARCNALAAFAAAAPERQPDAE